MEIPAAVLPFWNAFAATATGDVNGRFFETFHFDDNQPSADELAALVLAGRKRATASLLWHYESSGQPMPRTGLLSVVTDWYGTPLCVIETGAVDIVPFDAVSAEFAATEGEGDGSLAYWREAHTAFFARECIRIGRVPAPDMPVVCERFEVIYPARAS